MSPPTPPPRGLEVRLLRRLPVSLLDCEDDCSPSPGRRDRQLLRRPRARACEGPYDISWSRARSPRRYDAERIQQVRKASPLLVTIGACATGRHPGPAQFKDVNEFIRCVYASAAYITTLAPSTPISEHVKVDFELRGCPVDKRQLLEVLRAALQGARPTVRSRHSASSTASAGGPA